MYHFGQGDQVLTSQRGPIRQVCSPRQVTENLETLVSFAWSPLRIRERLAEKQEQSRHLPRFGLASTQTCRNSLYYTEEVARLQQYLYNNHWHQVSSHR